MRSEKHVDYKELFFDIADRAIADKIITPEERDTICRWGKRKCGYWVRHCFDLVWYIDFKLHSPYSSRNQSKE